MSDGTKIEWTDATWNIINGCSVVSPGCTNCYAMRLAGTRMQHHPTRRGLTDMVKGKPVWNGQVRFVDSLLDQPLRWKAPRMIFVCAHGDLFHENVPDEWIDKVFAVMALAPQHTFQVLTKRPERMRAYMGPTATGRIWAQAMAIASGRKGMVEQFSAEIMPWPLPNVWLGTSAEDQRRWDERIPELLATPAAVRWVSAEPLIGPIVDRHALAPVHHHPDNRNRDSAAMRAVIKAARDELGGGIDWIVAGGESGPGSRPMHPGWVRRLRDQCAAAGVAFLFKQWGDWFPYGEIDGDGHQNSRDRGEDPAYWHIWNDESDCLGSVRIGKRQAGRRLDGRFHDGYPSALQVAA